MSKPLWYSPIPKCAIFTRSPGSSSRIAGDISDLLTHQVVVDQSAWQKINEAEVAAGEPKGKPRVKSVKWDELLKLGLS